MELIDNWGFYENWTGVNDYSIYNNNDLDLFRQKLFPSLIP